MSLWLTILNLLDAEHNVISFCFAVKTQTKKQILVCISLRTSPSLMSSVMLLVVDAGQGCRRCLPCCRRSPSVLGRAGAQGCRGEDQREELKHGVWTSRTPWLEEINNPICDLPSGTGSGGIKLPGAQIYTSTLLSKDSREGSDAALTCGPRDADRAMLTEGNWLLQHLLGFQSPKEKERQVTC